MEPQNQSPVSLSPIRNPFVAGGPVREDDFIGRQNLIDKILLFAREKDENIILLFGQRRIGKTSLLKKIKNELEHRGLACPIYLNLQDQYDKPFSQLLYDMARSIHYALKLNLEIKEENFTGPDGDVSHYFRERFIPRVIKKLPSHLPLLFLLDETDVMVNRGEGPVKASVHADAGKLFIPFISDWIKEIQYKKYPIKLLLAVGYKYNDPAQKQLDRLARLGLNLEIGYFSREETRLLIKKFSGPYIPFKEDAINGIYAITAGHPFFTQGLACHSFAAAEKENKKQVTLEIVKQQVINAIKNYSAGLYRIWDTLSPGDQAVLYLMALLKEEKVPIAIRNLEKKARLFNLDIADLHLRQSLKRLASGKFIKKLPRVGEEYDFYVEIFRCWIIDKFSETGFFRGGTYPLNHRLETIET